MMTTIKPADSSNQFVKYILVDDKEYNCQVIVTKEIEEQRVKAFLDRLKNELSDEYEVSLFRGIPLEKEVLFIWPQIMEN